MLVVLASFCFGSSTDQSFEVSSKLGNFAISNNYYNLLKFYDLDSDYCNLTDLNSSQTYDFIKSDDEFYVYLTFAGSGYFDFNVSCSGLDTERYWFRVFDENLTAISSPNYLMEGVNYTHDFFCSLYDDSFENSSYGNCSYYVDSVYGDDFSGHESFDLVLSNGTNITIQRDGVNTSFIYEVSSYAPKLEYVESSFVDLIGTSSGGFKLGNYDFNLDYQDDLVVLEVNLQAGRDSVLAVLILLYPQIIRKSHKT